MSSQTNLSFWSSYYWDGLSSVLTLMHLFSAWYRWAVSSVMTRQNQIPTEDGSRVTLALIPLWDMCNHTNGLVMTSAVLCLIREAIVVKLESGHSTYKPFSPLIVSSKGSKHPSRRPQTEAGIFLSLCLLNPENRPGT